MILAETKKTIFTLFQNYWQEREVSERQHFSIRDSSRHNQNEQKNHLSQGASYLKRFLVSSARSDLMEQEETLYQNLKLGITQSEATLFTQVVNELCFCHAHNKSHPPHPLKSIRLLEQEGKELHSRRTPPVEGRDRMIYWTVGLNRHIVSPRMQKPDTQLIFLPVRKFAETNPKMMALFYVSPHLSEFYRATHMSPVYLGNTKVHIEFEPRNKNIIYTFHRIIDNVIFQRVYHHDEFVFSGAGILAAIAYRLIELLRFVDNAYRQELLDFLNTASPVESVTRLSKVMTALMPGWSVLEAKISGQFDHSSIFYKQTLSLSYNKKSLTESIQKSQTNQLSCLEKIINGDFVASGYIPFDLHQLGAHMLASKEPMQIMALAKTLFPCPTEDSIQYALDINSPDLFCILLSDLRSNIEQKFEVFTFFMDNGFNPTPHLVSYLALIIDQALIIKNGSLIEKMVDTLLQYPFEVNSKDRGNLGVCLQSPLHQVWDALIKNGLKINYYYKNRRLARNTLLTPLDFAIHLQDEVLISRLVTLGADVSLIKSAPENALVQKLTTATHDSRWIDRAVVIVVTGQFCADKFVILGNRRLSEYFMHCLFSKPEQDLSLPGVFVEPEETLLDAALRGLKTETAISLDLSNKNITYGIFPSIDVNGLELSFVHFEVQNELQSVKPWPGSHLINPKKVYWRRCEENPKLISWPKVPIRFSNQIAIEMILTNKEITASLLEKLGAILEHEANPQEILLQYAKTLLETFNTIKENPLNPELALLEKKYSSILNRIKVIIPFLNSKASFDKEIHLFMRLQAIEVLTTLFDKGFFHKYIPKKSILELIVLRAYLTLNWIAEKRVKLAFDSWDSLIGTAEKDPHCTEFLTYLQGDLCSSSRYSRW
ncbi:MAG: hypothetical protein WC785_05800 [Tatlockia sp.]|jgi:ADP-ribose pyrophosphatase YjhB (NUDIX family)